METRQWLIVGASRGIGEEFVNQLLARGDKVIATVRKDAASFWPDRRDRCQVMLCDVTDQHSIDNLAKDLGKIPDLKLDHVVLNAGILHYPNRATEMSFDLFAQHLHTNTIGPIICAQQLLKTGVPIDNITFISSDSGSAQNFREMEDGFAAYGASKAALNQALRHMAAELKRKDEKTTILALHPGEVKTDSPYIPTHHLPSEGATADSHSVSVANIDVDWEVEGQMSVQESVEACIKVIESKGSQDSGTFWTWENKPYPW